MILPFDLEEMVEDMFVGYLKANLPGEIRTYFPFGDEKIQYDAVVVSTGDTSPVVAEAQFERNQRISVEVSILVEMIPEKDAGHTVGSVRDRNRRVRRSVLSLLARNDLLNALLPFGCDSLGVSKAQYKTSSRGVDTNNKTKLIVTVAKIDVIACPIQK